MLKELFILSVPLFSHIYKGDKNLPLGFVVRFVKGNACEDLGTTSDYTEYTPVVVVVTIIFISGGLGEGC